jgi:Flp pilus assembly protein TadG
MLRIVTSKLQHERGAAMIEMALVLPLLALLLMGMLDFGRALNYWNDANQIAADGARFAAVNRNPGTGGQTFQQWLKAQADTKELFSGGGSSSKKGTIENPGVTACVAFLGSLPPKVGDPVKVKVKAKYNVLPIVGVGSINIVGSAVMRLEQLPTNITADASC